MWVLDIGHDVLLMLTTTTTATVTAPCVRHRPHYHTR